MAGRGGGAGRATKVHSNLLRARLVDQVYALMQDPSSHLYQRSMKGEMEKISVAGASGEGKSKPQKRIKKDAEVDGSDDSAEDKPAKKKIKKKVVKKPSTSSSSSDTRD